MEIRGQITIFPEKKTRELENGEIEEFIAVRGTISSKNEAGEYINKSVNVKFAGKDLTKEKVNKLDPEKCYKCDVQEGFISVNEFKTAKGSRRELEFVVLKAKLSDPKVVERKPVEAPVDSDLPF